MIALGAWHYLAFWAGRKGLYHHESGKGNWEEWTEMFEYGVEIIYIAGVISTS